MVKSIPIPKLIPGPILIVALMAASGLYAAPLSAQSFSLSTTAVQGPPETGFDSGLVSVGRLMDIYGGKPGGPPNSRSFPFSWSGLPAVTRALAVVLDDPDARLVLASRGITAEAFLHWVATDIDPASGGLPDNAVATMPLVLGKNGTGSVYTAPTPPADIPKDTDKVRIHVYRLKVYALSAPTGLATGFTLADLMSAIKDSTLGMAQLNLSYSNQ